MWKYVLKRIGLMLVTLFVVLTISFVLIKLLPPIDQPAIGKDWEIILAQREAMGYGKPILEQYGIFLKNILTEWNWGIGEAMYPTQSVGQVFAEKLPPTLLLNIYSLLLSVPLGILFGIFAALKKNKWQDHTISVLVMIFISVPSFIYAFIVQYLLSFKLGWFPFTIQAGTDWLSWGMFVSMVPPILALSFGTIAGLTRFTRAELTEVLTGEFMLLARTKGLTRRQATVRHALRNAMVPIFPMIIAQFISILSGSIIIEQIFGVPGVGRLFIQAINVRDYNFFMMLSAFYITIGLVGGIIVDLSYGFIDPRIRMGER